MFGLIGDLIGHQAWADAVFFKAWEAAGAQADEELRSRTDHILLTQEAFLRVIRGEPLGFPDRPLPGFGELKAHGERNHQAFRALASELDDAGLARTVQVPWFPDPPCVVSVAEALLQACMHSQHHRGQNMNRIKALGASPKNVDYIIWLWKQRPDPRWS